MKKYLVIILTVFLLTGCANNKLSVYEKLDVFLNNNTSVYYNRQNNKTSYFNYYLPSDMSEDECNGFSSVLKFNNSKIIMNINISSIVNSEYYGTSLQDEGFFNKEKLVYNHNGFFQNENNVTENYIIKVYECGDYYFINVMSLDVNEYGYCYKADLYQTIKHMIVLMTGVSVDKNMVLSQYSVKDSVEYQRQQIDLFKYVAPVNGYLSELIIEQE